MIPYFLFVRLCINLSHFHYVAKVVSTYVVVTTHISPNLIHFFFESDPFPSFFHQSCDCLSSTLSNARELYD